MTDGQGSCVSITVQVMQMFDKAEAEYRELSEKKRIVENDKDKIRKVSWAITYFCCHTPLIHNQVQ